MGSQQSSHANAETKDAPMIQESFHQKGSIESVRGRKSNQTVDVEIENTTEGKGEQLVSSEVSTEEGYESEETDEEETNEEEEEEETNEEIEAGLEERRMILEEAKLLKAYATFHLRPELPVTTTDPNACGRNYFSRPSAPEQESIELADERARVMEDVAMLKMYAGFHLHPERKVEATDATRCARNFFDRPSAVEQESMEEAEERARILEDCVALKKHAEFHLHPEKPVECTGGAVFGRSYFSRPSAVEEETYEEAEERALILEEAAALKKYAEFHLHPERPVETTDPAVFGRNYFSRSSAPEYDTKEEAEERERILEDCAALKKYAEFHLHPEKPVETTDPTASGRNYFDRASAPEQETMEEAEERAQILAECAALKKYAEFHLHPEKPVETTDPTAFGRNYFSRASAVEQETVEEAEERALILEEAAALKKYAKFHLHPEKPVETTDPISFGRNYFSRASAVEQETVEEAEERARILEDAASLKKYATFHLHPEKPVECTGGAVFGRNYFSRPSAVEEETYEEAEERALILEEVAALKKYATFHLHPEKPVECTGGVVFGRNYFSRPSAPAQDSPDVAAEREQILEEQQALKKFAEFHLHPEKPVESTDPTATGRNYFNRPSAVSNASIHSTGEDLRELDDSYGYHFGFDEDLEGLRDSLTKVVPTYSVPLSSGDEPEKLLKTEEEGNLSRSPSDVMLFGLAEKAA